MSEVTDNTITLLDKHVDLFSILALQETQFLNVNPYILACSILAASRFVSDLLISRIWPPELQ